MNVGMYQYLIANGQLKLMMHVLKCINQETCDYEHDKEHCRIFTEVMAHALDCVVERCPVRHCFSTRALLNHAMRCAKCTCKICYGCFDDYACSTPVEERVETNRNV